MPTPTPVPADSIPSLPAATPQTTPQATPTQPQNQPPAQPATPDPLTQPIAPPVPPATTPPVYHDPLEAPIAVPREATPVELPRQTVASIPSEPAYDLHALVVVERPDVFGSTYIPVDSPIYPLALRLYSLGYLDTAFLSMRPWTRRSLLHALADSATDATNDGNEQAQQIVAYIQEQLADENPAQRGFIRGSVYGVESVYTRLMGITDIPLRDSYHLGQTIVNDYGRPYAKGFNNITGFSSVNEKGRFSLYFRGEYQHAPAGDSYSLPLASQLSCIDTICDFVGPNNPQDTIPYGTTVASQNVFRILEATLSYHLAGHEISFGKTDSWMGPGLGGGMAWSDNADNIYAFRINRVEPWHIPYLSAVLGPIRYDFFVGPVQGHTRPEAPWAHSEMFEFAPTSNFQFGFQRTVIWGGKGHGCRQPDGSITPCNQPITLHTFLKSFFDINDTTADEKLSRDDPGARWSTFNFSWRLPFLRHYVTLYTDSIVHDDVTPPSAPRRAAYRPGLYLSQFPYIPKLDLRVEAASTDTSTLRSIGGQFNYYEGEQVQGYTNKGFIMGDWIGREAKGGQAWLTYHLSGDEWVQLYYLNKKTPKDFIPMGTTQHQFKVDVLKNLGHNLQLDAWLQYERWKAPIYKPGQQTDTTIAVQFTWYPKLRTTPTPVR